MIAVYLSGLFLLPLVSALCCSISSMRLQHRNIAVFVCGVLLFLCIFLLREFAAARDYEPWVLWQFASDLAVTINVGPTEILFAGLGAFLWPINFVYSLSYMRGGQQTRHNDFYAMLSLAMLAYTITVFSGDLFTMLLGYELLTLITIPLVAYRGILVARKAVIIYVITLFSTSLVFLLPAIAWTYHLSGTLQFYEGGVFATAPKYASLIFIMFVLGFAKSALVPFSFWLPAAMVAPTPVSAFLHAVAVVKAGVFCIGKVALYVFGLDLLGSMWATTAVLYLAIFTMLFASVLAIFQSNLKRVLAYSTISQLAHIVLGISLATPEGIIAASIHAVAHGVAKICLFFCAGIIQSVSRRIDVRAADGLGNFMPGVFIAFLVGSFSISGLPPFAGFSSKFLLLNSALQVGNYPVFVVILVCSLLSAAALLPIVYHAFFSYSVVQHPKRKPVNILAPVTVAAVCCFIMFFASMLLENYVAGAVREPVLADSEVYFVEKLVV